MDLRLHPCSVTPLEGPEKCGPRRPTRNGYSCNNAPLWPELPRRRRSARRTRDHRLVRDDPAVVFRPSGPTTPGSCAADVTSFLGAVADLLAILSLRNLKNDDLFVAHAMTSHETGSISTPGTPRATASPGVVARIVPGPHDAHRQDPHRPMRYDTGRPRTVIRFKISQPRTASLPLPGWVPGAKAIADDGLVSEERVLHPALTMVP